MAKIPLTKNIESVTEAENSLDNLLSEYGEITTDENNQENDDPLDNQNSDNQNNIVNGYDVNDKSNPKLYFQSGEKAGQAKPFLRRLLDGDVDVSVNTETKKSMPLNNVISGLTLLMFCDMFFPMIAVMINNRLSKNKLKTKDIKLAASQKKELEPLANDVAKLIEIEASPISMFFVAMVGVYANNIIEARNNN